MDMLRAGELLGGDAREQHKATRRNSRNLLRRKSLTGSGYKIDFVIVAPETELRQLTSVNDAVDVAKLPKVIGGDAVSVDVETGEEDETYTRGVGHPRLSAFLKSLRKPE